MADGATSVLVEKLGGSLWEQVKLWRDVRREAGHLESDVERMRSFLRAAAAAERSSEEDDHSLICVRQARAAVYDAEDALAEYKIHFQPLNRQPQPAFLGFLRRTAHGIKHVKCRCDIASEINNIRARIQAIPTETPRNNLNSGDSNQVCDPRLNALFVEDPELVGIDLPRSELIEMLSAEEESLLTISVVGMGGLGKTTLVKKVYDQAKRGGLNTSLQFETFAWIAVSQKYKATQLLGKMIAEFYKKKRRDVDATAEREQIEMRSSYIDAKTDEELIEFLRSFLEDKKFLLVLDDMWDIDAWESLKLALPPRKTGSRVIVTTRSGDVAQLCSDKIFHLQHLDPSKAWSLFCRKAFRSSDQDNCCPPGLKQLAYSFVDKCGGLPLAIISLGSLLSLKPHAEWDMIHRSLGKELENDKRLKNLKNILLLSFHDLPYHLKSCFLYLSIFPEDYCIQRMKLIRLWIAEGLVESPGGKSLEEVANGYLKQLIERSLVQVSEWKHFESVRSCLLHDILREIFIPKYEKEGFFSSSSELEKMPSSNSMLRRLSIYGSQGDETFQRYEKLTRIRSLFMFRVDNALPVIASLAKMRWLRVVDIENAPLEAFPNELTHLPHLRYLSLGNTKIKVLPDTVRKLKHLETLNLKGSLIRELPAGILRLQHLRHLLVYNYDYVPDKYPFQITGGIRVPAGIGKLKSLQKLAYVEAENGIVEEMENLTELRRLCVMKLRREDGTRLCNSIANMRYLQALDATSVDENELLDIQSLSSPPSLQRLYLFGRLENVPNWIHSLHNLVALQLVWCKLEDDPLKALQSLPSLVSLLLRNAYDGEELRCEAAGGYPNLKKLDLEDLRGLKEVKVENGAMSNLVELLILNCKQFENVPLWLQHVPSMKYLEVDGVSEEFKQSMYKEGGQALVDCVRHIPHISINKEHVRER